MCICLYNCLSVCVWRYGNPKLLLYLWGQSNKWYIKRFLRPWGKLLKHIFLNIWFKYRGYGAFARAPLTNYGTLHFKTLLLIKIEKLKFDMHIVHTKKSTMIYIWADKQPYGPGNGPCVDPKVPIRSSAGASLDVVFRAALGLVVSNLVLVQYWLFSIK